MNELAEQFKHQAKIMGALAHPIRLGVLATLLQGPAIVSDLIEKFQEDQTKISKHLAVLRKAGLVDCQADGRCRIYALVDTEAVERILNCMKNISNSS